MRRGPTVQIGELRVEVLRDGSSIVPGDFFGSLEGSRHASLVGADGRIELPIAGLLVRSGERTVLIDAGMGPTSVEWQPKSGGSLRLFGGELPAALAEAGVAPEQVDLVLATHLHGDHVGWIFQEGRPFFPNAVLRFGAGDWEPWVERGLDPAFRANMRALARAGRIAPIERDGEVAPGISALQTRATRQATNASCSPRGPRAP
jgi:glyoxylase-like metal-dependent hydrolase (beta-lactamase superfamily II)